VPLSPIIAPGAAQAGYDARVSDPGERAYPGRDPEARGSAIRWRIGEPALWPVGLAAAAGWCSARVATTARVSPGRDRLWAAGVDLASAIRPTPGLALRALERLAASPFVAVILLPALGTRLLLLAIGLIARAQMHPFDGSSARDVSPLPWVSILTRWDSWWYLEVIRRGYSYKPLHGHPAETTTAFSPLYPLLIRALSAPFGPHDPAGWAMVGIVLSNVLLLSGLAVFVALVRLDFDSRTAARACWYLLACPASLFLSAMYPESLFLLLAAGTLYAARTDRWWLAGLLAGLAALSRPLGVLLALPLGWEYLAQAGFRVRALRPTVAWLGLAPVAFLGWAYELYRVSGDPLMVLHAHAAWDQRFTPPWETLLRYLQHPGRNDTVLDLAFTVALAVLVVAAWRLLRSSYALLATALFLGVVSRGSLVSMPRYALELFPLFVVLALAGRRWAAFHRGYVALSLGLGSLFMVLFALGYWVA